MFSVPPTPSQRGGGSEGPPGNFSEVDPVAFVSGMDADGEVVDQPHWGGGSIEPA